MRRPAIIIAVFLSILCEHAFASTPVKEPGIREVEQQFTQMPMEARRLTGPLFWLHGDESKDRLELFLGKLNEGHNGAFCAESRPHNDWLGPKWYEDLDVCLQYAKKNDLKMWIFDERWWPSQTVAGKVPPQYAAKRIAASAATVDGPARTSLEGFGGPQFVTAIAGKLVGDAVDPSSLTDLKPFIHDDVLSWDAPAGKWQIMNFTWALAPKAGQGGAVILDGASKDCVDWFLQTVYQPHYDRFKDDFGKTIVGYFYDEPETQGDWGTELSKVFAERGIDEKKALVAWKFKLAGDEQIAARYAYIDSFAETWGRTMYGGMSEWCQAHGVSSIGHFMEHNGLYLNHGVGAINLFQMQKYCTMGGMDLVCQQMYPGQRPRGIYQLPKLTSSISHAYNKSEDLAMCEIFGAYGQGITYPQMKWLCDQHQVRGVNFLIPHSFNPRAPKDTDCPPYFYDEDQDARWPLYRVWADYTNRLSLMLSGGRHVCPIAFLFCGDSAHVGKVITPEEMTNTIQDARYDCDWLPYEVFEGNARISGKQIGLYTEQYRVLIVPPVEAIPYATLAKVKQFMDAGGIVVGYGFLPAQSASLGHSSAEIASLVSEIWGTDKPGLGACKTTPAGGRSYFLPENVSPEDFADVLTRGAGVRPVVEVMDGDTNHWLHVLHRVRSGSDVFLICNQDHQSEAKHFRLRLRAKGEPECWDAMRNEITRPAYKRLDASTVDVSLILEPSESVLIVFRAEKSQRPLRLDAVRSTPAFIPVARNSKPGPNGLDNGTAPKLLGCSWVWFPEGNPKVDAPAATRWFRKAITIPNGAKITQGRFAISADNTYTVYINGVLAGKSNNDPSGWKKPGELRITQFLKPGRNVLAIASTNLPVGVANPAGLIGSYSIEIEGRPPVLGRIDQTWKASDLEQAGWNSPEFDDSKWTTAREIARFGEGPWTSLAGSIALSDPFVGKYTLAKTIDLKSHRIYLELADLREGASIKVNGEYAGGIIGAPFRLDITKLAKTGVNTVEIEPYAPTSARLVVY